jgi:hypothetical protein
LRLHRALGIDLNAGHLRAAITSVVRLATVSGCRSQIVEDLDFADARQVGRETLGRGRRAKRFRTIVAGIPTRRFRDLLVGMAANAGLWTVAVDPVRRPGLGVAQQGQVAAAQPAKRR